MGKRPQHGGGGGRGGRSPRGASILNRRLLAQRISDAELMDSDPSIVVDHLRSSFSDYNRLRHAALVKYVTEILQYLRRRSSTSSDGDEDSFRRNRRSNSSSSAAVENDDSTATSDDAVFEAKLDPCFDITKSMLRNSYSRRHIEMETVVVDKPVDMHMNDGTVTNLTTALDKQVRDAGEVVEVAEEKRTMFRNLGGMKEVIEELMMEVIVPLCNPQLTRELGVRPMSGILLHGPPGCGKTKLAHAIANEAAVPFYKVSATEFVSGISGASEESIRDLFKKACRTAPSIIFIDEIDAIASKRDNMQREMERRIVTQLMTCMDSSHETLGSNNSDIDSKTYQEKHGYVLVIGATNRPNALDQALRRPGRFDREIVLGFPDENARLEILSVLTPKLKLEGKFDLFKIARSTPGFVGADLAALVDKAGNLAMKRIMNRRKQELSNGPEANDNEDWLRRPWNTEEMKSLNITMPDFEEAAKIVQPSSRREGFSSIPNVKWEDVGGLKPIREELEEHIVHRIKNPEAYEHVGANLEAGVLLYGPPGCGKTLIAKAVANEAGANFIHIKGPEIFNKYVGESELAVRTIFSRARTCSPCILFFDEVDALTTMRGKEEGSVAERLVNQLLIELDGSDQRHGVYVIGATNRIEIMDPAILRPGRFGVTLYVPLPRPDERGLILKALARRKPIHADVDLDAIGHSEACKNFSGADLLAVMNRAAMAAVKEYRSIKGGNTDIKELLISSLHFDQSLRNTCPSVTEKQRRYYKALSKKFKGA